MKCLDREDMAAVLATRGLLADLGDRDRGARWVMTMYCGSEEPEHCCAPSLHLSTTEPVGIFKNYFCQSVSTAGLCGGSAGPRESG